MGAFLFIISVCAILITISVVWGKKSAQKVTENTGIGILVVVIIIIFTILSIIAISGAKSFFNTWTSEYGIFGTLVIIVLSVAAIIYTNSYEEGQLPKTMEKLGKGLKSLMEEGEENYNKPLSAEEELNYKKWLKEFKKAIQDSYPNEDIKFITKSSYWSTDKIIIVQSKEALSQTLFKDEKLDPVEGIWLEQEWGLVAIKKRGLKYVKYEIDLTCSAAAKKLYGGDFKPELLNGTQGSTIIKTSNPKVFKSYTRLVWPDGKGWFLFATCEGEITLKNKSELVASYSFARLQKHKLTREWPEN